jgi:hypothetical protein
MIGFVIPTTSKSPSGSHCRKARYEHVAGVELGEGAAELAHLSVIALVVRSSRIAVNHGVILHRIYAPEKRKGINGLVLVRNS